MVKMVAESSVVKQEENDANMKQDIYSVYMLVPVGHVPLPSVS